MSEFTELLDELDVPDHGTGFWHDLEARLAGESVDAAAAGRAAAAADLTAIVDDAEVLGLRRRPVRRWVIAAIAATAAAVIVAVALLSDLTEDSGPAPVVTDISTTTMPAPDTEEPPFGPDPSTSDLAWSAASAPVPESEILSFLGVVPWGPAGFSMYDRLTETWHVSSDGREWATADFLPDGFTGASWNGWNDDWVTATVKDVNDAVATVTVAVSPDAGVTWESLPPLEPVPFASPLAEAQLRGASAWVIGDTVLLSANFQIIVDNEAAMVAAGHPDDELTVFDGTWTPEGEYVAHACSVPDAFSSAETYQACVENLDEYPLGDLGLDTTAIRFGSLTTFHRSVDGAPFEPVDLPAAGLINTLVVANEFVVLTAESVDGDDPAIFRSADGATWTSTPFSGDQLNDFQATSVATTLDSLFGLEDNRLIRSTDNGRTWETLATPVGEIDRLVAGPGGVVLVGRLGEGLREPIEPPLIERNGFSFTSEEGVITVRDAGGSLVARAGADPQPSTYTLENVDEGVVYFRIRDAAGEVVLEITDQEVVDLTNTWRADPEEATAVIAWSPDGDGLVWQTLAEAFVVQDGLTPSLRDVGVGDTTIIATLQLAEPARPVDFRSLLDDFEPVDPIEGRATVMMSGDTTEETFVAELP